MAERRRPPWWMYLVLVPCTAYFLLSPGCVLALGPETIGFGVADESGVVGVVQPGLAADRAGLREGDTLLSLNGQTGRAAWREIAHGWVGQRYDIVVRRGGVERTLSFTLGPKDLRYWTDPEGLVLVADVPISALGHRARLAHRLAAARRRHRPPRRAHAGLPCRRRGDDALLPPGARPPRGHRPAPGPARRDPSGRGRGRPGRLRRRDHDVPRELSPAARSRPLGLGAALAVRRRPRWDRLVLALQHGVLAGPSRSCSRPGSERAPVACCSSQALVLAWPVLLAWNYRGLETPTTAGGPACSSRGSRSRSSRPA